MPKILAIDDINDNLISLKAIISDAFPGAVVFTALNGPKGIELAIACNPDVILLDVIMPGMDGFEVCRQLKQDERVSEIPVVFLTAIKGDKESRIKALEVGAEGFLTKPIDETELIAQIRAMVKIKVANEQKRNEKNMLETLVAERTRELENSQARLKGIFENLQDAYFQADLSGRFTIVSPSAVAIYGFESIDEIIGLPAELLYFDLRDRNTMLSVLRSSGRIKDFVCRGRKKDGSPFWVSMNVQLIYSSEGQILGTEGVVRDISNRKQAEEELRVSKENFRQIVERSNEIFYRQNLVTGQFEYVSPKTYDILGYTTDEFLAQDFNQQREAIHPEDLPRLVNFVNELVEADKQNQKFITKEYRIKNKKGEYIWVRGNYILIRDEENNPAKVIGSLSDITERKLAKEELIESEEKYRRMVNLLPDAIIIHTEGKVAFANVAAHKIIGLSSPEQLIGKSILDFVHPDCKEPIIKRIKEIYETGEPSGFAEEKFITSHNKVINAEVIGMPVSYKGKPAIQTILRDITERKHAEEALWESQFNFKALFEKGPIGVAYHQMIYDEIGNPINYRFLDANESYQKLTGVNPVGKLVTEAFPGIENDPFDWIGTYGEVAKTGKEIRFQQYLQTNNRWYDCVGYQYKPDHFVAAFFEITDKKLTEEKMSSIFRVAPTGIGFIVDRVIMEVNPRITEMTGFSKEELIGQSSRMFYPTTEEFNFVGREKYEQIAIKGTGVIETRWQKKDGSIIHILLSSTPINQSDISKGVIFTALDITERKQAEIELRESNELNHTLLQTIPFGMDIVDEQGNILFQNERISEIVGGNAVGKKCWELYREDKHQCNDCPLLSGIKIGETEIYESRGVLGDKIFQISHTGMMFRGQKAMLEIFQDITGRKESELALQESEDRYRRFISQVSEGVYRFESDEPMDISLPIEEQIDFMYDHLTIAECNNAFLKMYGVTNQKEMIGKTMTFLHGGRNNKSNRDVLCKFVENNYHIEETVTEELNTQGQKIYISNTSIGILENNKLVRIWGTQTDISSRVRASQVQQVLYSISNAALSSIDLSELIEFISKEIGKLLDSTNFYIAFYNEETGMLSTLYERDEKDVFDSWPAEKSITGYVIKYQKSMRITYDDVQELCDAGEIELFGTPSKVWLGVPLIMNKKVIGALVVQSYDDPEAYTEQDKLMLEFISHQISISIERKKAEQELNEALVKAQESDRLKSAFLANMSHEIRTPLNSIIGFSELMCDPDFDLSQQFDFSKMIHSSGNNLLTIITDIMDLSKIEAGQVVVRKELFSVNDLIHDIHKEYSFMAAKKGIRLEIDLSEIDENVLIESDESALRKILINFVGNAIKFTKEGCVEIGVKPVGKSLQFTVKDTGIGIPAEFHKTIFERFRQIESFSTRKYGGNGLGLAISKSLVELLGGKIWMESESGKGSAFYFAVPVSE